MRSLSNAILILGAVQLIESLAFALPISFFPNYVLGLAVSGYGIPFFVNGVLGLLTTTMIMLFIKEPEDHEKAPQFTQA